MEEKVDKQEKILEGLKHLVNEIKYGSIVCEFKIHEGRITAGEIIEQKIKLG